MFLKQEEHESAFEYFSFGEDNWKHLQYAALSFNLNLFQGKTVWKRKTSLSHKVKSEFIEQLQQTEIYSVQIQIGDLLLV